MRGNSLDIQKLYIGGNPASGGGNNNLLINGCLRVWQRGQNFSPLTSNHQYTADRWYVSNAAGFGDRRVAHSSAGGLYMNQMLLMRRNGDAATNVFGAYQRLEPYDTFRLRGKTVTFSCYIRCGASYSGGTDGVDIRIATVDDVDPATALATGGMFANSTTGYTQERVYLTPTTTLVRHSVTMTVPATAWQLQVAVRWQPVGTTSDTADWVGVEQLQLEIGDEPTDMELRPLALEQALCERYYEIVSHYYIPGVCTVNTTLLRTVAVFKVQKRITPTVVETSGNARWLLGGTWTTVAAGNLTMTANQYLSLITMTVSGATVAAAYATLMTLSADAEL